MSYLHYLLLDIMCHFLICQGPFTFWQVCVFKSILAVKNFIVAPKPFSKYCFNQFKI